MGDGNKVEFLVAICALITSVMAVYMAWDQGRVMRAQQHGMVYPVLQIEGSSSNTVSSSSIGITVKNSGVGPALIQSVSLKQDGKRITHLPDVLARLPMPDSDSSSGLAGRALAPGAEVEAILMRWDRANITREQIREVVVNSANWELAICYCSVFDRCWETEKIGTGRAKSVDSCEQEDTDIFGDFSIHNFVQSETPTETPDPDAPETE